MANKKIYTRSWRIRKAYWTAFKVMTRYLRLHLMGKIFGRKYYQKRIIALHLKNAKQVKEAILQLQGLFIKVGQLLSILSNFLPEAFQEPLEALQDQIPARPIEEIKERIIDQFGQPPEELFEHFETTAIASASIGQVHRARLQDQTEVVVKVQHANIEKIAETDLQIMQRLIALLSRFFSIKGLDYAYTQVRKMIEEELDFTKEAASMQAIRENLQDELGLAIPEVHEAYSTKRVLTTTYYPGVKISNLAQLEKWNLNRTELANRLLHAYCQMVFEDGFYHADPHPGNILVQEDGTLVLLDFGAVATLKPEMRTGFLELIEAAAKNDRDGIIDALKKLGFIANEKETIQIAEKMIDGFRNFLENEVQFEGLSFKDIKVNPFQTSIAELITSIGLRDIAGTVQVPKDYVLLNRMVTLLAGICTTLDNYMNPLEVIQPYFQKFVLGEKGDWVKFITNLIQETLTNALAIPRELRKVLNKAERGELELQIAGSDHRMDLIYHLGQQAIFTFLIIAASTFGYLFYQADDQQVAYYAFGLGAFFLLLLFRSMRRRRK